MITDSGLSMTTNLLLSGTTAKILYYGIGSGTSFPSFTDSSLEKEAYRAVVGFANLGSPIAGDTYSGTVNSVQSYGITSVTEQGLLSASTGGQLFSRATHNSINIDNGSNWFFEWDIKVLG